MGLRMPVLSMRRFSKPKGRFPFSYFGNKPCTTQQCRKAKRSLVPIVSSGLFDWMIVNGRQARIKRPKNVRGDQGRANRFHGAETEDLLAKKQRPDSRGSGRESDHFKPSNGRGPVSCRPRRHRCPCAPGSNPGKTPGDRHAAQKALL